MNIRRCRGIQVQIRVPSPNRSPVRPSNPSSAPSTGLARSAGGNSSPRWLRRLDEGGELSVVHCPLVASWSEPPDPRTTRHSKRALKAQQVPNNGQRTTDNAEGPKRREGVRTILGLGFVLKVLILLIYAVIFIRVGLHRRSSRKDIPNVSSRLLPTKAGTSSTSGGSTRMGRTSWLRSRSRH
jgi:hypothetical protein